MPEPETLIIASYVVTVAIVGGVCAYVVLDLLRWGAEARKEQAKAQEKSP